MHPKNRGRIKKLEVPLCGGLVFTFSPGISKETRDRIYARLMSGDTRKEIEAILAAPKEAKK